MYIISIWFKVKTLTRSLQKHQVFTLQVKSQWRPDIFLLDFLAECRLNGCIHYCNSCRSRSKAAPTRHTTITSTFDCWLGVSKMLLFYIKYDKKHKMFHFSLISLKNIFLKAFLPVSLQLPKHELLMGRQVRACNQFQTYKCFTFVLQFVISSWLIMRF